MKGIFITGTDTGVGKTVLSALLLGELRRRGINASPFKPVQTGCGIPYPGSPTPARPSRISNPPLSVPDLDYALAMASLEVDSETYGLMAPYTFEPACSPHLAAEQAGTEIDIAEVVIAARTLAADYEFIVAEGAGGILVPLNRRETTLDLMQALKFPVLVAARPGLGTINHTLLSIRALRDDGLDIAGIVFIASGLQESGLIEADNVVTVERFGKVPVLGTIPHCAQLAAERPAFDQLPIPVAAEMEKIVNRLGW